MATARHNTFLSLDRFAKIFGIPPVQFNGCELQSVTPTALFPVNPECDSVWPQHDWQDFGRISRDQLAMEIEVAEREVIDYIRCNPAPGWNMERKTYPKFHRQSSPKYVTGYGLGGGYKSVNLSKGKLISGGRLTRTEIASAATVVYSDEDGDGYKETATITIAGLTTEPGHGEVRVYPSGKSSDDTYWLRYAKSVSYSAGTLVIVMNSWLLLVPDQFDGFPSEVSFRAVDASDTSDTDIYLGTVDVYRVYNDWTSTSVEFIWEDSVTTETGVFTPSVPDAGIGKIVRADYSDGEWGEKCMSASREPDMARVWYYSGMVSDAFENEVDEDPMPMEIAKAIAYIAGSRLMRGVSGCSNLNRFGEHIMHDTAVSKTEGVSYFQDEAALANAFGTRVGEVKAWRILKSIRKHTRGVGSTVI